MEWHCFVLIFKVLRESSENVREDKGESKETMIDVYNWVFIII